MSVPEGCNSHTVLLEHNLRQFRQNRRLAQKAVPWNGSLQEGDKDYVYPDGSMEDKGVFRGLDRIDPILVLASILFQSRAVEDSSQPGPGYLQEFGGF